MPTVTTTMTESGPSGTTTTTTTTTTAAETAVMKARSAESAVEISEEDKESISLSTAKINEKYNRFEVAQCNQPGAKMMLVVDSEADNMGFLAAAALPQVAVVVYNSLFDSTKEFVSKIEKAYEANGGTPFTSIAFANHAGKSWVLATDCTCHPGQDGWLPDAAPLISALARCVAKGGRIDLLGCRLLKLDPELPDKLEKEFEGIQFTASDDDTGNPEVEGDWVMESDGIDISADYFDPTRLKAYTETMAAHGFTYGSHGGNFNELITHGRHLGYWSAENSGSNGPLRDTEYSEFYKEVGYTHQPAFMPGHHERFQAKNMLGQWSDAVVTDMRWECLWEGFGWNFGRQGIWTPFYKITSTQHGGDPWAMPATMWIHAGNTQYYSTTYLRYSRLIDRRVGWNNGGNPRRHR